MNKRTNIVTNKNLKWLSILLSFILCFNLSFANEEEVRQSEKEVEIEIIYQVNKIIPDEIEFTDEIISYRTHQQENFSSSYSVNRIPYKNVKLYIFHCQLALKGCMPNII